MKVHKNNKKDLLAWVSQYYTPTQFNQTLDNGQKLLFELYISELKLAIELNPLIWHGDEAKDDKNIFYSKMNLANAHGIRVINIFEDEWIEQNQQVKSFLKSVLKKNSRRFKAKYTKARLVSKKDAAALLNECHIQGSAKMDVAFGLYDGEELLAVMSGSKHHRQGQEGIFILNRLVFKDDVSIEFGASKLLNHIVAFAKENGYKKLISWSDNRFSEGDVYSKIGGFKLGENIKPDYSYIKGEGRVSKQSCQKKHLVRRGAIGGMGVTERVLAMSLGLFRIYDCGKKQWFIDL